MVIVSKLLRADTPKDQYIKQHASLGTKMNVFRRLTAKSSSKHTISASTTVDPTNMPNGQPHRSRADTPSDAGNDAPPAYRAVQFSGSMSDQARLSRSNDDSPYAYLRLFDTMFVIDDSGSMAGRNWRETSEALAAITPICTEQDADGVDIYFLNHRNPSSRDKTGAYTNITTMGAVQEIFRTVRPSGGTPTGMRLRQILRPYLTEVQTDIERQGRGRESQLKPLNIIVITDGVPSDDVESTIVSAARKLDKMGAEPWQVGIQFFQVGQEEAAAQDLQELDDCLADEHGVRDMVDTVPWNGHNGARLTAEGIMKVTMGAINRRLDRKRV